MRIRPMSPSDRPAVKAILEAVDVFSEEEVTVACELIDDYLNRPGRGDYIVDVCEDLDGVVLGYACWGRKPLTDGVYDLYWLAVAPSAQGRGAGAALLRHLEASAASLGGRMVLVETSSTGPYDTARAFYERMGYSPVARLADFYRMGDDLVLYRKLLEPAGARGAGCGPREPDRTKPL